MRARQAAPALLAAWLLAGCAAVAPAGSLADGREGRIPFRTLTLSAQDFARGVREGLPVVIWGDLALPRGGGRVPAVIIAHGSSGITGAETGWAKELLGIHGILTGSRAR